MENRVRRMQMEDTVWRIHERGYWREETGVRIHEGGYRREDTGREGRTGKMKYG
jgi:hypothetical protein